jgi:hypothetical protein
MGKASFYLSTGTTSGYKKNLEGIQITEDLLHIWRTCFFKFVKSNLGGNANAGMSFEMDKTEAIKIIQKEGDPQKPKFIPINVLRALRILLNDETGQLEKALQYTSLYFTPPPEPREETEERRKYRKRIERLRLRNEETKYSKLTSNLQSDKKTDDITAKSMTYAASVGLNMIIAPLSFGCFMFFFAGGVFDYFLGEEFSSRTTGGTDIKRVIVGVVSGVVMLFIEMLLFVIRTHEFESYERKKQMKKRGAQPFGVYSKKINSPAEQLKQELVKQD